jgi:hypothetical protein
VVAGSAEVVSDGLRISAEPVAAVAGYASVRSLWRRA